MSTHSFLFTYSVSPVNDRAEDMRIADVIRKRIANLNGEYGWIKLENVETAFKGEITVTGFDADDKLDQAQKKIEKIINTVFDETYTGNKVWISIGLLVDGLKAIKEFKF